MKTLTINGQTFIVVDADAMKKIADTDLNMNGHDIVNVRDIYISDVDGKGEEYGACIHPEGYVPYRELNAAVLAFYGVIGDEPTILRNIADGQEDNDSATVGQLNAAVGDIETALDKIIAIQESLIGGAV